MALAEVSERYGVTLGTAWISVFLIALGTLVGGSLAFPRAVYTDFIWKYYWGPVYADAHDAQCVAWHGGQQTLGATWNACATVGGPVAHPGYTPVSEVSYAIVLLFMLTGVLVLLQRLEIGNSKSFFYALLPFMFFGGALRNIEDASNAIHAATQTSYAYPWNTLIISPEIYVVMFALAVGALLVSVGLDRLRLVSRYEYALAGFGTLFLIVTLGVLGRLSLVSSAVSFHPWFTIITVVIATLSAGIVWILSEYYWPSVTAGTGLVGILVVWGQAIDGASNVLDTDWATSLGLQHDLYPKHPADRAVIALSHHYLPRWLNHTLGASWPFLVLKVAVATFVVSLFTETMVEDNPRYTILLLIAIIAVGLGPGTRDMLRATFGI